MRELLLFGAGGHGKVALDTARAGSWNVVAMADGAPSRRGEAVLRTAVDVIGVEAAIACCREKRALAVVSVGDNRQRRLLYTSFLVAGIEMATLVHPAAAVSVDARLGAGTVVFAGAVVQAEADVRENAIVNTASSVDHDCVIGAHSHVGPGVHMGGASHLGRGAHLGVGTSMRDGVTVGDWSVVGLGAAIVSDVPDNVVAYGCPARVIRPGAPQEQAA